MELLPPFGDQGNEATE